MLVCTCLALLLASPRAEEPKEPDPASSPRELSRPSLPRETRGWFGCDFAVCTDIDGDDVSDCVIGDPGIMSLGHIVVVSGKTGSHIASFVGPERTPGFGRTIASLRQASSPGKGLEARVLVGAPKFNSFVSSAAAYVVSLPTGRIDLELRAGPEDCQFALWVGSVVSSRDDKELFLVLSSPPPNNRPETDDCLAGGVYLNARNNNCLAVFDESGKRTREIRIPGEIYCSPGSEEFEIVGDCDGGGLPDVCVIQPRLLTVVSTETGRELWKAVIDVPDSWERCGVSAARDVDMDGVVDLAVTIPGFERKELHFLSGKTGGDLRSVRLENGVGLGSSCRWIEIYPDTGGILISSYMDMVPWNGLHRLDPEAPDRISPIVPPTEDQDLPSFHGPILDLRTSTEPAYERILVGRFSMKSPTHPDQGVYAFDVTTGERTWCVSRKSMFPPPAKKETK